MKNLKITVNGVSYDVQVEETGTSAQTAAPVAAPVAAPAPAAAPAAPAGAEAVTAPMAGTVLKINVAVGQKVKAGEAVIVLESMKMENEVPASKAGEIASVNVNQGDMVESGQTIVTIK